METIVTPKTPSIQNLFCLLLLVLGAATAAPRSLAADLEPGTSSQGGAALALASGDFDADGRQDLVVARASDDGGLLELYLGTPRTARAADAFAGFASPHRTLALPFAADLLVGGDLDADGHADLVAAARGRDVLVVARGDGRGGFEAPSSRALGGPVTALAGGEINRRDGLIDLVVAIDGDGDGPRLLVLQDPHGALGGPAEHIILPSPALALAFTGRSAGGLGNGDPWRDLLIETADGDYLLAGRDRRQTSPAALRQAVPPPRLTRRPGSLAAADLRRADARELRLHLDHDAVADPIRLVDGFPRPVIEAGATLGALFTVGSAADDGDLDLGDGACATIAGVCTLRAAIDQANALPGPDAVTFALGGAAILPSTPLIVAEALTLDGTGTPPVEIDGSLLVGGPILELAPGSDGSTVRALTLHSGPDAGLQIRDSDGHLIERNHIGADVSGSVDLGNAGPGVRVIGLSTGSTIGGTTPAARNIVSGNGGSGIELSFDASGNTVAGNFIGLAADGLSALGNDDAGVLTHLANVIGGTAPGSGNVISHNAGPGVEVADDDNLVQGNLIGLDVTGSIAAGNGDAGVFFFTPGSIASLVGGTTPAARNVISANATSGIEVRIGRDTLIQGNRIGTDAAGLADLGNGATGVLISTGIETTIGGVTAGAGNLISGNTLDGVHLSTPDHKVLGNWVGVDATGKAALGNSGVGISAGSARSIVGGSEAGAGNLVGASGSHGILIGTDSLVQGNTVGTDTTGTVDLGNGGAGVFIAGVRILVGGSDPGAGNLIVHSAGDGVAVDLFNSLNTISSNRIYANDGLAIDLEDDGVGTNDPGDGDVGSNGLQNFPVLTTADGDAGSVSGTLDSSSDATFTIELFTDTACDASGHGEAGRFLGSTTATTDGTGIASFSVSALDFDPTDQITATATSAMGDTSELSACLTATGTSLVFKDGFESGDATAWSSTSL